MVLCNPERTGMLLTSVMSTHVLVKVTVQTALQMLPMPTRVCLKLGMMWPLHAGLARSIGRSNCPVAVECWIWPVAVPMHVLGAAWLMLIVGTLGTKYVLLALVLAMPV